jgi:hypothetical protein
MLYFCAKAYFACKLINALCKFFLTAHRCAVSRQKKLAHRVNYRKCFIIEGQIDLHPFKKQYFR